MNADQKLGIGLVIFCIITWFYFIPYHIAGGNAPKFFPRLIIFFILVPAILLIVTRKEPPKGERIPLKERKDLHKALTTAGLFLIYISLIGIIGYFTTSFLAIIGFLYFFGQRNWKGIILVPAGILLFIYFVIENMLSFPLPKGLIY
jgi:putative tricarboxylic transport membrane protein